MAQHILGLDLGAHAVKAVLLESTYRGYAVAGVARAEVAAAAPPGPDAPPLLARQAAALEALLAAQGWRVDTAVVAFPGAGVASYLVTLPFTDLRRIEQTIAFEVEGQIPFELDTVAWDWQPLGARDGRTDLLVGVARKEELAALLAALASAGIDPRAVVPAAPAYAALAAAGALPAEAALAAEPSPGGPAPEPATLLLDLGAERTSLCVVAGGGCVAARTFPFGGAPLARGLARELGLPEAEALAALGRRADPEVREADPGEAEALARAAAPLLRELRATLRAWRTRGGAQPVGRLLLAGGSARLPGLAALLAPEVEGPVTPLALTGAAAPLGADAPELALALALALRGHQGTRAPRLNLRRGELAFTRDFEHLKGKVIRLGAYVALLALLAVASAGVKVFALSRQEAMLDRALCDAETRILGKCYEDFDQAQAILRGRGPGAATVPKVSAVELFAEVAARVPMNVPVRFDRIEITRDKLRLEGATDGAENVDKIVGALKASRCFGDAKSLSARKRPSDGKFEFAVDSSLTCLETGLRDDAGGRG